MTKSDKPFAVDDLDFDFGGIMKPLVDACTADELGYAVARGSLENHIEALNQIIENHWRVHEIYGKARADVETGKRCCHARAYN